PAYGNVRINADNTITYTPFQRTINRDGSVSYTQQPDPNGLVVNDTFSYLLKDTVDGVVSGIATVRIVPDDQAPVARDFNLLLSHALIGHPILINPISGAASDPLLPGASDALATDPTTGAFITPASDGDDPLHAFLAPGSTAGGGQVQVVSPTEIL